jgi:hypothetical protein
MHSPSFPRNTIKHQGQVLPSRILPKLRFLTLLVSLVMMSSSQATSTTESSFHRAPITGMIDSDGYRGYWEKRPRQTLSGIIITSETYIRFSQAGLAVTSGLPSQDNVDTIEVFDVHRIQLIGTISSEGEDTIVLFPGDELPQEIAELLADQEYPVITESSPFWSRTRALVQMIEPSLNSYVRRDEIKEEGRKTRESTLIAVQPRFRLALQQSKWSLVSHYNVEFGEYVSGDFNDFVNHELATDWGYKTSQKNQFNIAGIYRNWQDKQVDQAVEDFNSGLTDSFYHESLGIDFSWRQGLKKDRFRSEFVVGTEKTNVESDIADEFGYRVLQTRAAGTGFWRVRRKLTLLLDGLYQDYDYKDREDSNQFRLATGVDFWVLKRVAGRLLVGYQSKSFDSKSYESINDEDSGIIWNADVIWRPQKTTTVGFRTARQLLETYVPNSGIDNGSFGVQQHAQINLDQRWNPTWDSNLTFTYQERDFDSSQEELDAVQIIFGTNYRVSPKWTLRGIGAFTRQEAKIGNDFDRWTLTFHADMRL